MRIETGSSRVAIVGAVMILIGSVLANGVRGILFGLLYALVSYLIIYYIVVWILEGFDDKPTFELAKGEGSCSAGSDTVKETDSRINATTD